MMDLTNHPWMSGLFGDPEIASILSGEAELERYLKVEAAWTRALGHIEEKSEAEAIATKIEQAQIDRDYLKSGFAKDGVAIPALVNALRAEAAEQHGPLIHTGLTSQDVIDTALVLALKQVAGVLQKRLADLNENLSDLAQKFGKNSLIAYTRMQPALETDVSHALELWQRPIEGILEDFPKVITDLSVIQWGGPIGRRGHPKGLEIGQRFADTLGLSDPGYCWHTDRTRILNFVDLLTRMSICTGKIGEDIALWSVTNPKQISLTGGSSSAMPHKNNPIAAETLVSLSDYVATIASGFGRSSRHEGNRSGQAWSLETLLLSQACVAVGCSLFLANKLGREQVSSIGT